MSRTNQTPFLETEVRREAANDLRHFAGDCERQGRRYAPELTPCTNEANRAVAMAYRRAAEIVEHGFVAGLAVDLVEGSRG